MAQRVREHDWAATSLGAVERWPAALRTTVQLLLAHPFASIVLWGPQLIQIYNDAYRKLMGVKHPVGLGQPTRECWPEVWHINAPIYERVRQGEAVCLEDALFPITRSGVLEDAWFSLTYSPVRDETGRVAGVFLTIIETTRRLRAEAALRQSQVRQTFLLCLSDGLRSLQDAQAIKRQATRLLGEQLDVNRAFYAEVRGDDWVVAKGYEQGVTALPDGPYAAQRFGPWIMAAYRAGQRIVFHDVHTDPRFSPLQRQAHAAVQILGAVGVPLVKQGALVAILTVHSAVPRYWSEEDVALVEETAERTWAAVERARAEAAQRQSEVRLTMIFERALVGLSEIAPDGRFVRVNSELGRIVDRDTETLLDLTIVDVTHPDDVAPSLEAAARVLAQGGSATLEKRYQRPDGTLVVAQSSLTRLEADAGGEPRLLAVTVDLTARRQAEEALRQSEERLRLAMNVGELATWDWDMLTGRIVWSREHFHMQGYAVGEVEPSYEAWLARIHPDDRAVAETALRLAYEQHEAYNHEFRTLLPDGSMRWMSAQGLFFHDVQGQPNRMIGVMRDITEQRNVRELLEHEIEQRTHVLRQLLMRVESVQDEERRRIARELHDGLGQYLTAVTLAVGTLRDVPTDSSIQERVQRLGELMQHLDRELDRMVFLLRPTALDDCGVGEGVAAYVRSWSELTGVRVDLALHGLDGERLPVPVETAVFRVVQEALNNVAKHARASRASVNLQRRGGQLAGCIEDDGVGFEAADTAAPAAGRTHWGLVSMRERIEALGGTFAIESHAGEGTSVLLRVPLH
ncbi:PAS domain-containing protein [Azohydromonas australica]|uniref:PAS domain-containing protein n=1 Tax=Azohydromonas australica TaxID=364039 RepID=UPI000686B12D|nr:PAS domain-containing protein [Azohydromonas australica]